MLSDGLRKMLRENEICVRVNDVDSKSMAGCDRGCGCQQTATNFAFPCELNFCRSDNVMHIRKSSAAAKFDVGRLLGSGGFGTVFEGSLDGQKVAVKKMHSHLRNPGALNESLRAEKLALSFSHGNIVLTLAVVQQESAQNFLVIMEFAGTRNLQNIIDDEIESLGRARCLKFTHDICHALEYLHDQNIVHLDLKPANVIIDGQDNCKLGDFGCCQSIVITGSEELLPPSPTRSYLTGTFPYRAPELLRGELPSVKADMYSLAICIWQMLTREQPYGLESHFVVIFGVVAHNLRPSLEKIPTTNDFVTRSSVGLMQSLWKANPEGRPSAKEVLRLVQELKDAEKKVH